MPGVPSGRPALHAFQLCVAEAGTKGAICWFRDIRLCVLWWTAGGALVDAGPALSTMRAGLDTWMCLSGGFRTTLGCACWGGKDFGGGSGVFTVTGHSRAPPGYGFHFGPGASISRVAAPKRPSDCPSTSPIMSPRCFPSAEAARENEHRKRPRAQRKGDNEE